MSPGALDLLEKMLVFDPNKRITGTINKFSFDRVQLYLLTMFQIFKFSKRFIIMLPNLFAVEEALCHPYMSTLHDINDEPVCPRPFSFDFEQPSCTEEEIKELIWRASVKFNPDPTH